MTQGRISKVVKSFGSQWGRIRPTESSRDVFFNLASLKDPEGFQALKDGQYVEFDEEEDRSNGTHAINVVLIAKAPVSGD